GRRQRDLGALLRVVTHGRDRRIRLRQRQHRSDKRHQRFAWLLERDQVRRVLEPDRLLVRRVQLLQPAGGGFRGRGVVVATQQQHDGKRKLAYLVEPQIQQLRQQRADGLRAAFAESRTVGVIVIGG